MAYRVKKVALKTFCLLASEDTPVYLVIEPEDQDIVTISVDPSYFDEKIIKETTKAGQSILVLRKFTKD